MKNLLWQGNGTGWTTDDEGHVYPLTGKPALSFQYDALYHESLNDFYVLNGSRYPLSPAEITEVENFIATVPQDNANKVMGVDAKGKYLGLISPNDPNFFKPVKSAPYNGDHFRYDFNTNQWIRIEAVDSTGKYLGNIAVDDPNYYADVQSTPPYPYSIWDFTAKTWKDGRTLDELKVSLCNQLDALADQTSLRFVTPGFTQSERYAQKLEDAKAYQAAGYPNSLTPASIDSVAYPYIYWETNQKHALDSTVTGQAITDMIIQTGSGWRPKGAQIEGYRTAGKRAIMAAADTATAQSQYNTYAGDLGGM